MEPNPTKILRRHPIVFGLLRTSRASARTIEEPILARNVQALAEILVGLGFLQSVFCIKPVPTHEKIFAVGAKWPKMPLVT